METFKWLLQEWVCVNSPEARAVLSQGVQDGVRDIGTARHTQRLQAVATPANCDETLICDLLLKDRESVCLCVCIYMYVCGVT